MVSGVVDARYYFGEPVNGAKVQYAVYRDRYWFPLWYDPEETTEGPPEEGRARPDVAQLRRIGETATGNGNSAVSCLR